MLKDSIIAGVVALEKYGADFIAKFCINAHYLSKDIKTDGGRLKS